MLTLVSAKSGDKKRERGGRKGGGEKKDGQRGTRQAPHLKGGHDNVRVKRDGFDDKIHGTVKLGAVIQHNQCVQSVNQGQGVAV